VSSTSTNVTWSPPGSSGGCVAKFTSSRDATASRLPDMTEGERPQERSQRGRCPQPGEEPAHPPEPKQIHVIDRVSPNDHPRDDRGHLQDSVGRTGASQRQRVRDQAYRATPVGQREHRRESRAPHEIGVIENRRKPMRDSHLPNALLSAANRVLRKSDCPCTAGHSCVTTRPSTHQHGGSRLNRQRRVAA
jgi:hypothetical protein